MELDPQTFFSKLNKSIHDSTYNESFRILDSFNRILNEEQTDREFIDSYLPHIFHTENSLLKFVNSARKNKCLKKSCEKALEIIYTILNNCYSRIPEKDILLVYSVASEIFHSTTDSSIKCKFFDIVQKSLELNDGCVSTSATIVYKNIVNKIMMSIRQTSADSVKAKEMELLGYISKKFPFILDKPQDIKSRFWYCFDMYCASIQRKLSQKVLEGFYNGYGYYIESFPMNLNFGDDKMKLDSFYKNLKHLVILNEKERIKIGNKAAIKFFSNYSWMFKDHLLKEYKYWHEKLLVWFTFNADCQKIGSAALRSFCQTLSKGLEESDNSDCKNIIQYFVSYSKKSLLTENTSNLIKRHSIFCLRELSQSAYKHLEQYELTDLFLFIMQTFERTFIQDYKEDSDEKEYLPDYLQTVANFVRFKQLSTTELFCLQKGVITMMKSFHLLPVLHHYLIIDSLLLTLFYLKDTKYFDNFVENVVYQGVIYSCSHQHISVEAFLEGSPQSIVTVNNYLPLWKGLLNLRSHTQYDKYRFYLDSRKYVLERIVNELIKTLMILINKLNVSLKEEDDDFTDVEKAFKTEKINDYVIFLNTVDFYSIIIDDVDPRLLKRCICKMIDHVMTKSAQFPLISGFYKLISYFLKVSKQISLFDIDDNDVKSCKESVASFLSILFDKMAEFKDDLLISCLRIVLEAPVSVIEDMLPACVAPFINIFEIGRSYLPLAEIGIDTLEYWQDNIREDVLEPILGEIIPSLDSFLRSKFLKGYNSESVRKRRKTVQVLKKRKIVEETEPELIRLQRKILGFIGRQSLRNCRDFIFSDSTFIQNQISGQNVHLKITLPYEDLQLEMHLDTFLPRIVELALYSSDRKTRITSCELLQACVMVFLGRAKPMSSAGLEDLNVVLKTLLKPLIILSCDIDQVVRQIFEPLFFQLIHWYTSPIQSRSLHTSIVIETMMETITHPTNSNLKDFSGRCVKEFVKWTLKHEKLDPQINIKVLVKQMRFFSNHPDPAKKLGAALIFNNIYRELREIEKLVSIFWLEILHIFIQSLDSVWGYEETSVVVQTKRALVHLQRVIIEKPSIFRKFDKERRIPNDLEQGLLINLSNWLLKQTASSSLHCRCVSMEIFINIAPLSTGNNQNLRRFIEENVDYTVSSLYDTRLIEFNSLKGESYIDCASLFKYLRHFICALDGYKFIVANNLEKIDFEQSIFKEIQFFLQILLPADLITTLNLIETKTWNFSNMEKNLFISMKEICVSTLLKLINALLHNEILFKSSSNIWTNEIWYFITNIILQPQGLNNRTTTDILTVILNTIPNKFPNELGLKKCIEDIIKNYQFTPIKLDRNVPLKQRNLLKGVVLINNTSIGKTMALKKHITKLLFIFLENLLKEEQDGTIFINNLQDTTYNYIQGVLKFVMDDEIVFNRIIEVSHSILKVQSIEMSCKISFGVYFLTTFKESVIPIVVNNFEKFLVLSLKQNNINITMELIIYILSYVIEEKEYKKSYNDIINNLLMFWNNFVDYFSGNVKIGVEFLKKIVQITDTTSPDIQNWLIECVINGTGSDHLDMFDLMAKMMGFDLNEKQSNALKTSLMVLNEKIYSQSKDHQIIENNFNKLVTFLPVVKSDVIFEYLTEIYITKAKNVEIYNLVEKFTKRLDSRLQSLFLERIYKKISSSIEHKYEMAKEILSPMFENCELEVFEQFFVNNIENILKTFLENDLLNCTINFILVEILFLRIPIGTPERITCAISTASKQPKLLRVLLEFALNAFQVPNKDEITRKYKCHAYNALTSIICNSVRENVYYEKLFVRRSKSDNFDILWHGIVNTEIQYDFPKDFDSIPVQKKILVNIRDELRRSRSETGTTIKSLKYIESQRLFNSSLSEDVTKFDFTNSFIRDEAKLGESGALKSEIFLDTTEINRHECMSTICSLIQHMRAKGIFQLPTQDDDDVKLPSWMEGIRLLLLNKNTHKNVKIFLVKIIDNSLEIFSFYAKWFLEPLIQFVVENSAGCTINYFVSDVLVIISQWASEIANLSDNESRLASNLLDFFVKNLEKDRQDVFKYNLELLKLIVESWKQYLAVPTGTIREMFDSERRSEIAVYVASVFLVNGLRPWSIGREREFLDLMLRKLNCNTRHIYRACAETLGSLLSVLDSPEYVEKVDGVLGKMADLEKYVVCLEGIAIKYPTIVNTFHAARLISSYNQVLPIQKIVHLKILYRRLDTSLDILEEMSDFKIVNWHEHIDDSNLDIQILTMEIIKKCLKVFATYPDFEKVSEALSRNTHHPNSIFRGCMYDAAIGIYNLKKDTTGACKQILISGLIDSNSDNRQKIIDFWMDPSVLPSTVTDRFSFLLSQMYKSDIEDKLLGLCTYFLIGLLDTSEKYDTEIFEHPLEDCDFEEYKLRTDWKLQHPSVVPMFAETLDIGAFDNESSGSADRDVFALRRTQTNFEFAATQSFRLQQISKYTAPESSLGVDVEPRFKHPNAFGLHKVQKRRFLKDKSEISRLMAHRETNKRIEEEKARKESDSERERKITIYRSYRKGDFPDIQIPLSALLKPLQILASHDQEISKILFLEIFKGVASKIENNRFFLTTVSDGIKIIFNTSVQFDRHLFTALLDILLKNKEKMSVDPKLLSYVALESGLASTGALLIEEYIIHDVDDIDGPTASKRTFKEDNKDTLYWIKLAELYKELEDWDVVKAIFLEKMDRKESFQKAVTFESKCLYREASNLYKQLIHEEESQNKKDFYYDSYFKCFANLGEWGEIPRAIKSVVDNENTWDGLWNDEWAKRKLLPWYITSRVKNELFRRSSEVEFLDELNGCLKDSKKLDYLNGRFAEELCALWLSEGDIPTADRYSKTCSKHFLANWQILNPMFQSQRYRNLLGLRNVAEISDFIDFFNNFTDDIDVKLKSFIGKWSSRSNAPRPPSVLLAETKLLYRKQFVDILKDKLGKIEGLDVEENVRLLDKTKISMDIDLINYAADAGNFSMAKKYMGPYLHRDHPKLNEAKGSIYVLKGNMANDVADKINFFLKGVDTFQNLLQTATEGTVKLSSSGKIFDALVTTTEILNASNELFQNFQEQLSITLNGRIDSVADIENYGWSIFKKTVENCTDETMDREEFTADTYDAAVSKAYTKLAQYVIDKNCSERNVDLILFVLRAMRMNSVEARRMFPCLLMLDDLGGEYRNVFTVEAEKVPVWMFLGWIPQLLANVDSSKLFAISDVIRRIAETYPQAIMYPYRISKDNYKFTDNEVRVEAASLIERLDELLLKDENVNKFLKALSYVSVPANILIYHLRKIENSTDADSVRKYVKAVMDDIFVPDCGSENAKNMQGNIFKDIKKFRKNFENMSGMESSTLKAFCSKFVKNLRSLLNVANSKLLKDFCPWLANFSANKLNVELEIPGQYDGRRMPLPQYHVKIAGFHPEVKIMESLRKPIKMTMLGMNTKEYPFLIKFGEDIRQDQRIEQMFCLMNDILRNDAICSNSGLDILTYQVIPLTPNLGIIQWINDAIPLQTFLDKSLKTKRGQKDIHESIREEYISFLNVKKMKEIDFFRMHGDAAENIKKEKIVTKYMGFVKKIPWDALRTSFWSLSTSTENYIALRNNFIKTYAVTCATHWILGIGDRHLNNILICTRNGKVLGIDFGHAFGTATQILPVPELVPFRLTPHLTGLMAPLKERGSFREYMISCLRCLRASSSPISATMTVFIREPSIDWLEHAGRTESKKNDTWYPMAKINQAARKLGGANPADIMLEELRAGTRLENYTEAYIRHVKGDPDDNLRARLSGRMDLSPEDQVDCLIDHATDYNLLGRMYFGWRPWV
ncbi:DNA-dependent protein kinase catalytic subunit-like isoform X1 [Diorhabda sublineata]|uniref:DNA-dependent protein kinase catalytic subunit-like isoform X1 n=1 Tax=Diorhabda sublineata TaxID=1163346 RepID=UPI0024E0C912|nr:DNA-dependent protein kinase catalytic subunit-like isoform X1 [Diorhabda sublineata]